ncbi:MAG: PIN domain-containing protein [Burkholderiales bacterium]
MTEKVFADTNVVIYAQSRHPKKSLAAVAILETSPVISTQVVNETVSVLTRKHGFALADANQVALSLLDVCEVVPVSAQTVREAIRVGERYNLSIWDSLIIGAALLSDCEILYSEDLQDGQVFGDRLKIVNPFK